MNKRYAIVRVDNRCPDFFCKYKVMKDKLSFSCNDCNLHKKYGDTKEQLIAKVKQALQIGYNKGIILSDTMAKFIVEFLGVE